MKKGLKLLGCALCAIALFGCKNQSNDETGGNSQQVTPKSLAEQIDDAASKGVIDFGNAKIAENVSVDDKITIKNLDLGDKTVTVCSPGVVLENVSNATVIVADGDVTLKNCSNIKKVEVSKESCATDSVVIDASKIETIEIGKKGIRIVLKDEKTEVKDVVISAENTIIEAEPAKAEGEKAPAIEQVKVTKEADKVSISGGEIGSLTVETAEETPVITLTGDTSIEKIEGTEIVYVAEDAKVDIPDTVEKKEAVILNVAFYDTYNEGIKRNYLVGDKEFDLSNIYVEVFYLNRSRKTIPLTKENCTVEGFDTSIPGEISVHIIYDDWVDPASSGRKASATIKITVRKPDPIVINGTADQYIAAALEILSSSSGKGIPNIDLALEYFKKAYETEKTDETKLFYALAEIASISTDESVAKLLRENFGLKNYPATPNALLSDGWFKQYIDTTPFEGGVFEKSENSGFYVRGNFKENWKNAPVSEPESYLRIVDAYILYNGEWMRNLGYGPYSIDEIEICDDGNIMFNVDWVPGTDGSMEDAIKEFDEFMTQNKACRYSYKDRKVIQVSSSLLHYNGDNVRYGELPEFKVIDENDAEYQATLFKSMQTTETVSYLMVMNFFNCNAKGFNLLIDNILNVFGTRYEHAKALVSDIEQESITVPSEILTALHLDDILGVSTVKIGKAEVDVLFAATDIIKAVFQWFSSYDLSMDVDILPGKIAEYKKGEGFTTNNYYYLREEFNPTKYYNGWVEATEQYFQKRNAHQIVIRDTEGNEYSKTDPYEVEYYERENEKATLRTSEVLRLLSNSKSLTVRNASAMEASKKTILNSVKTVMASYDYITGEPEEDDDTKKYNSIYPSEIKAMIKAYGDPFYELAGMFADALENDDVFTLPAGMFTEEDISIDLGKFFTPGYFSNIIEKDNNGNLKVYVYQYDVNVLVPSEGKSSGLSDGIKSVELEKPVEITDENTFKTIVSPENKEIKSAKFYGYTVFNTKLITDLVPSLAKMIPDEMPYPLYLDVKFATPIPAKTE